MTIIDNKSILNDDLRPRLDHSASTIHWRISVSGNQPADTLCKQHTVSAGRQQRRDDNDAYDKAIFIIIIIVVIIIVIGNN